MLPPLNPQQIRRMRESQLLPWIADPFSKHEHSENYPESVKYSPAGRRESSSGNYRESITNETIEEHLEFEEATPIELFYDLFFVANLTTVTGVQHITGWKNLSSYILFFIILWFTWLHVTLLDVRFSVDSVYERCCKILHFAVMAAFSSVSTTWDPFSPDTTLSARGLKTMTLTLMFSRFILGIQYFVVMAFGRSRKNTIIPLAIHGTVMVVSASVYLGLYWTFNAGERKRSYIAWYVMATFEIIAVIATSSIWRSVSFKKTHLVERMGLLTLIILGEGIIVMLKGINSVVNGFGWTRSTFGVVAAALAVIYLLWMFYFDYNPKDVHYGTIRQQIWAMLHFPFHLGIVLAVEGLRQLTTMQSFNLLATEVAVNVSTLEPLDPAILPDYLRGIFQVIYEDGSSKLVLKDYKNILSSIDSMQNEVQGSTSYEEYLNKILYEAFTGLAEYYGIKAPEAETTDEQLVGILRVFNLVFQYFYVSLAVIFVMYGVFAIIVRRHMDIYDYISIGLRFAVAAAFLSMLGLYYNPVHHDSYINFMWGGPWPIPQVCLMIFFVLLVDKTMAYLALKRLRN